MVAKQVDGCQASRRPENAGSLNLPPLKDSQTGRHFCRKSQMKRVHSTRETGSNFHGLASTRETSRTNFDLGDGL
jgi:hypothetical protein